MGRGTIEWPPATQVQCFCGVRKCAEILADLMRKLIKNDVIWLYVFIFQESFGTFHFPFIVYLPIYTL